MGGKGMVGEGWCSCNQNVLFSFLLSRILFPPLSLRLSIYPPLFPHVSVFDYLFTGLSVCLPVTLFLSSLPPSPSLFNICTSDPFPN